MSLDSLEVGEFESLDSLSVYMRLKDAKLPKPFSKLINF